MQRHECVKEEGQAEQVTVMEIREATKPALQWCHCWPGNASGICNCVPLRAPPLLSCPHHSWVGEDTQPISELWRAWLRG